MYHLPPVMVHHFHSSLPAPCPSSHWQRLMSGGTTCSIAKTGSWVQVKSNQANQLVGGLASCIPPESRLDTRFRLVERGLTGPFNSD